MSMKHPLRIALVIVAIALGILAYFLAKSVTSTL